MTDNLPRTDDRECISMLQHALGLGAQAYEYRNHYYCSIDDPRMKSLVDLGLAEPGKSGGRDGHRYFHVTEKGREVAWQHMPALKAYRCTCVGVWDEADEFDCGPAVYHAKNAAEARYDAWLSITESVAPDAPFISMRAVRCPEMDRKDPAEAKRILFG